MFKNIFKNKEKTGMQEELLAPETKPVIGIGRIFIIDKGEKEAPAERISYKLIKHRRRERTHNLL